MKDKDVQSAMYEVYLRELAFWTCVNKIANAISKCEFKTYIKKKEDKRTGVLSLELRTKSEPECNIIHE